MITYGETINAADSVSTNVSCSMPINAANTASINFADKKKETYNGLLYFVHGFISGQILSLIAVIYCHYTKHRLKQKLITPLINFKNSVLKITRTIISMT